MLRMKKSLLTLALSSTLVAQVPTWTDVDSGITNLGGSCYVEPLSPNSTLLDFRVSLNHSPGSHALMTVSFPPAEELVIVFASFTDPNVTLPSCGCVAHLGALDILVSGWIGGGPLVYPPSAAGFGVYMQGVQLGFSWGGIHPFGFYGLHGGCSEAGLGFRLTDGYLVALP